jgi:hypothetical protein
MGEGVIVRDLPVRWGSQTTRYLGGLALLFSGAIAIQGGNSYALFLIVHGSVAFIAGWIVLPAGGLRRGLLLLPAFVAAVALIAGPQMTPAAVVLLLAWLVLWRRRALSYLAVIPLAAVTVAMTGMFQDVSEMVLTTPATALTLVGCAWLARFFDREPARLSPRLVRSQRRKRQQ